jgi:hypothetical protein
VRPPRVVGPFRAETKRATLVDQLYESERGKMLAELLADIETGPDDLTRLLLIGALREVLR